MLGNLLNDNISLALEIPKLKEGKFSAEIQEIIDAIEDYENPFMDIFKKLGKPALAFSMQLANICAQEKLNRGYEN